MEEEIYGRVMFGLLEFLMERLREMAVEREDEISKMGIVVLHYNKPAMSLEMSPANSAQVDY